jgi:hypothetical protein
MGMDDLGSLSRAELQPMLWAVERAQDGIRYWLKNHGYPGSKYSKPEIRRRQDDLKALNALRNHLASAVNKAPWGGTRVPTAQEGKARG